MVEVIPAIIEDEWSEVKNKLLLLKDKTDWVHLDASDGVFTPHKTWDNPQDLLEINTGFSIEAHLMIEHPLDKVNLWVLGSVKRIIVHWEALGRGDEIKDIASITNKKGVEIVLAINPKTKIEEIKPYLNIINGVLVMGVNPGWSGGEFQHGTADKIKALRQILPNGIIEVDGGINAERAPDLVRAGANRLVSSSFIWSFSGPDEGISKLKETTKNA